MPATDRKALRPIALDGNVEAADRETAAADALLVAALIERCEALLARISRPATVLEEIEAFRLAMLERLSTLVLSRDDGATTALATASEQVHEICDRWLGGRNGLGE